MENVEDSGLTGAVIGAAIEVHRVLGPGFAESVYETALCAELAIRGVPYEQQHVVHVDYKGRRVGELRLDLCVLCAKPHQRLQVCDASTGATMESQRTRTLMSIQSTFAL